MSGELALYDRLANDAAYNAHVGGSAAAARIFYDEVDQAALYPNTTIRLESIDPNDTKSGASTFDFDMVQIYHSAETKKKSSDMAINARTVLDRLAAGTYNGVQVESCQFVDQHTFTERIVDKKIFTTEQIYKVIIHR